ncbi:T cell receptor beta chain MC.7.G5-like isoform X1 [Candoia aspera]|uniref:T cell receptor beta chain MC.7.G5-like isoform X1 n=1 Tax=Candoia aspera TaxID=51853 RepID=UPI002FD7B940
MLCATDKLYFGQGTRLTVLEKGRVCTPPVVTIFSPSKRELQEKQKATIVCLVTDFYPDHINLTWSINGKSITEGVKTEEPKCKNDPKCKNETYSLISRLRITRNQWQNSKNIFKCQVDFYNCYEDSSHHEDFITGEECDGNNFTGESYVREINVGKLVYILLIFKSALYAAFIMGLKLRKKVV